MRIGFFVEVVCIAQLLQCLERINVDVLGEDVPRYYTLAQFLPGSVLQPIT